MHKNLPGPVGYLLLATLVLLWSVPFSLISTGLQKIALVLSDGNIDLALFREHVFDRSSAHEA